MLTTMDTRTLRRVLAATDWRITSDRPRSVQLAKTVHGTAELRRMWALLSDTIGFRPGGLPPLPADALDLHGTVVHKNGSTLRVRAAIRDDATDVDREAIRAHVTERDALFNRGTVGR